MSSLEYVGLNVNELHKRGVHDTTRMSQLQAGCYASFAIAYVFVGARWLPFQLQRNSYGEVLTREFADSIHVTFLLEPWV
jgi:hypothetical protein